MLGHLDVRGVVEMALRRLIHPRLCSVWGWYGIRICNDNLFRWLTPGDGTVLG